MFTTVLRFRPIDEYDLQPQPRTFEDREEALRHGMRSACMNGITDVDVYEENNPIATYTRITNYWFEFKNDKGEPISHDAFFAKIRKATEQQAIKDGLNIRIRHQGLHWRVLAGEHSIPIDKEMLPWVSEAVQEITTIQDYREEDGLELHSDKELLEMFSQYLLKRISDGLTKNPKCFSRLRWDKPFNNL